MPILCNYVVYEVTFKVGDSMLSKVLHRKDVRDLIKEVYYSSSYRNKKNANFINNEIFADLEGVIFVILDALFKYKVIIEDEKYLDGFMLQLNKIIQKIDDLEDIYIGINKIIGRTCAIKLNLQDSSTHENKEKILRYIYDKYIVNGYLFHGFSGVYKGQIMKFGFIPEQYQNLYPHFLEIEKIFSSHGLAEVMDKNFYSREIYFTDSFLMGCYYGANAPMYFSKLLCKNSFIQEKQYDNGSYFKDDYQSCLKNLNQFMQKNKFSAVEKKQILKTCCEEWKLLQKETSNIHILLIKRERLDMNYLKDIGDILANSDATNLGESIGRILNSRNNRIPITSRISDKDLKFIEIPCYRVLFGVSSLEHIRSKNVEDASVDIYGKVSFLVLLGSICITLGVILTIIMFSRGV